MRIWLFLGSLNGLIAVVAGAYGWHGLAADEGGRLLFTMGVVYQMWHALALLAVAWLATRGRETAPSAHLAGGAFAVGIVLFSGSLYAFALTGAMPVPYAAPVGGFCFMAGWAALIWTALTGR